MSLHILPLLLLTALLVSSAQPVNAEPPAKAKELLNKAIQAHGGSDVMDKLCTATWKGRGLLYKDGKEDKPLPFFGDWSAVLYTKYLYSYGFKAGGGSFPVTNGLNGEKGWRLMRPNSAAEDLPEKNLKAMQEEAHAWYVSRLVPLLSGDYQLTVMPVAQRDNRFILGLKADRQGYRTIYLFFDRQKSYLTYMDRKVLDPETGKEVMQETSYLNFKQMGDATLPQSITIRQGKKLAMELEIDSVTPQAEILDKKFEKPPAPKDD